MAKLRCKDFGFKCGFILESQDIETLIKKFRNHTIAIHEKAYSEDIMKHHIVDEDE